MALIISVAALLISLTAVIISYVSASRNSSPYVVVYLSGMNNENKTLKLVVKNIGNAPAFDVKLDFTNGYPEVPDYVTNLQETFLKDCIKFLPPNESRLAEIGEGANFIKLNFDKEYCVDVTYFKKSFIFKRNVEVSDQFTIEVNSFVSSSYAKPALVQSLDDINSTFEKLKKVLEKKLP